MKINKQSKQQIKTLLIADLPIISLTDKELSTVSGGSMFTFFGYPEKATVQQSTDGAMWWVRNGGPAW